MDVEADITALYALPLEEFVAARNELAKRAKKEAAAELAPKIKALRKPTTTAWLANQLARQQAATVSDLVELGEQMREATAARDGARLRDLTGRRKELVDHLLSAGAGLARGAGLGWSDEVTTGLGETFHAALADPAAGAELRAGRLSRALENVGFGPVLGDGEAAEVISFSHARAARGLPEPSTSGSGAGTAPASTASAGGSAGAGTTPDDRASAEREKAGEDPQQALQRRRSEAEAELETAQHAVTEADDRVDDITVELDRRRQAVQDAEAEVQRLSTALEAARGDVERAQADVAAGQEQLDRAETEAEAARSRRREAKQQLSRLRDERLGRT